MTRDEQLIKAALDMAAATCEKSAYAADADGHHFAYSIRAIPIAEVLAGVAWRGPGEIAHQYSPDWMAQGDCQICGHTREAHQPAPNAVAQTVEAACVRVAYLEAALSKALEMLTPDQPGDSRAVDNWFVACAAVSCDLDDPDGKIAEELGIAVPTATDAVAQTASSCPPPQHGDETYYSKGNPAEWWIGLTDEQFAWELICAAQDLNDTGLGDDLDKWTPHQIMLADAAKRIKRLSTADTEAMARLRTENERLRAALRPFAAAADDYCDPAYDDDYSPLWAEFFVVRDFRRARAALAARRQQLTGVKNMNTDPRCPRCGTTLKIERVKVLVERHAEDAPVTFHHYEERDEVADCPRCTGSY